MEQTVARSFPAVESLQMTSPLLYMWYRITEVVVVRDRAARGEPEAPVPEDLLALGGEGPQRLVRGDDSIVLLGPAASLKHSEPLEELEPKSPRWRVNVALNSTPT